MMMVMIVWNPNGFRLIDAMLKREEYSARFYIDGILTSNCQRLIAAGKRKFVIHADNFRCQIAKVVLNSVSQGKVRFAMRPPYSPDVTPSDFSFSVT
jgi:hypothetical protein